MVNKIFQIMDRNGSGVLDLPDIGNYLHLISLVNVYDVSMNPEFIEGRKTKDQILSEFLNNFEGSRGNRDG